VATVREELARKTPAQTLAEWGNINGILRAAIEKLVGVTASNGTSSWGVDVENVRMEEVDLGRTVNEGLRNVPRADLDKKVTVTTAEGESEKRRLEGIGSATALQVLLEAKSIGYAKIAEALKLDKGSLILQVETAREAMEKSKYSLVAGSAGMADIFNIVAAIQGILPRLKPEEEK
jgi:regulator of protease activity HflC (stomatin/prohibitin superfamily)